MKKWTKVQRQKIQIFRLITVGIFILFLSIGFMLGNIWFLRPDKSEVEKRELTSFPTFTFSTFMDGTYFSDISTWYSDTFVGRDTFIAMNQSLKQKYGIHSGEMMVGTLTQSDEIPVDSSQKKIKKDPVVPDQNTLQAEVTDKIMEGLYIEDGAAYGGYSFSQEAADTYIDALEKGAEKLDGITNVYSLLIPNNSGVILDDETCAKLGGSNQGQAIEYYFNSYDKVTGIEIYNTLKKHNDEYLYFRTDHHWTQQGAYYAYKSYCKLKGFKAEKLSDLPSYTFTPFLGTYYNELQLPEMAANPDTVYAYAPKSTNDMLYDDGSGNLIPWKVIQDVSTWNEGSGYYCFVAGDKPYAEIDNPEIEDGTSCVVIKESYGNCFIPFLVDHYDKVYYMDFRYTNYNIVDFCKEHNVTDLIVENNIQIIGSGDVASRFYELL